ncbi:MAG: hypothetical protein IPG93_20560 [Burkholderiales bacterium]|nr:hypothetical protein [Burkholderiales bacterium]
MLAAHSSFRSALSWLVLGAAGLLSLWLLNGAAFSAWMSSGPPNPYPDGWVMRSHAQLAWSIAVAIGGFAAFRMLRELPTVRPLTLALLGAAAVLAALPTVIQFLQIDHCLDSGGRWNYQGLQCER